MISWFRSLTSPITNKYKHNFIPCLSCFGDSHLNHMTTKKKVSKEWKWKSTLINPINLMKIWWDPNIGKIFMASQKETQICIWNKESYFSNTQILFRSKNRPLSRYKSGRWWKYQDLSLVDSRYGEVSTYSFSFFS